MGWRTFAISVLTLLFGAAILGDDTCAVVEGFVTAEAVAPIYQATVAIDNRVNGVHLQTQTDALGHYNFANLQPGRYMLWAEVQGYGCIVIPQVALTYGQHLRQDFHFAQNGRCAGCLPTTEKTR